jgi:hypothetical protein
MFHWTESRIRVHVFYCVLALDVAHLMRRHSHRGGLDLSVHELRTTVGGIEETVLLYPTGNKGRPRAQRILNDIDPPRNASTTSSGSAPSLPNVDMGNTPSHPENRL